MAPQPLPFETPLDHAKSQRVASPKVGPTNGDGILEDFLAQWQPDVLSRKLDHTKFFDHVVELARSLTGADGAAIAFRGDELTICRARVGDGAPPLGAAVDTSSGISKDCLEWGMSIRCDDMSTDSRVDPETCRALGIRSLAVVPIFCDRRIAGILEVFSVVEENFTDQHLQRLQKLAKWVGAAASTLENRTSFVVPASVPTPTQAGKKEAISSPQQGPFLVTDTSGWNHVLLPKANLPWRRFVQSVAFHLLLVGLFWGVSELRPHELDLSLKPRNEARVTYYPFSQSAPPRQDRRDQSIEKEAKPTKQAKTSGPAQSRKAVGQNLNMTQPSEAQKVASGIKKEQAEPVQPMPEVASSGSRQAGMAIPSPVLPAPDLVASHSPGPGLPDLSAIAPAPNLSGAHSRRGTGFNSAVVPPPATDVTGRVSRARSVDIPSVNTAIVSPPPSVTRGSISGVARGFGSDGLAIAPTPSLEVQPKLSARGGSLLSGGSVQLIAPPASIDALGTSTGRGRASSLTAHTSDVIAPSPSLQDGPRNGGGSRSRGFGNGSSQVVAPSPSLQGSAKDGAGRRAAGFGIAGSSVIPPPASLEGGSAGPGGRRVGSLSGNSSSIVAAPPSIQNGVGGNSGPERRVGALGTGNGLEVVPPQPSLEARAGAGGRGSQPGVGVQALPPAAGNTAVAAQPSDGGNASTNDGKSSAASAEAQNDGKVMPVFQDAEVKVISLAWAPPKSSYFSNFEVFIAEKWLSKNQTQVIKLVYVFLPYQRRLSEYGVENPKVRRLRVTRDPSCDESLMQISWPEGGDGHGAGGGSSSSATAEDRKNLLPCYRTNADDYRKAISRNR